MPHVITCQHGHRWELDTSAPAAPPGTALVCPVCGSATLTLQPSDREPDPVSRPNATFTPTAHDQGRRREERKSFSNQLTVMDDTDLQTSGSDSGNSSGSTREEWPTVEGYEILGELGRGGMGVVYKARQIGLNRIVALKMLLGGVYAGWETLARFKAEAEAVAQLQHPNIIQIHDVGQQEGRPYFSLEYADGGSLSQRIADTPQPPRPAAHLLETLARAVHEAHQRGIIHRDLKPANIMLVAVVPSGSNDTLTGGTPRPERAYGVPKITDFGLAKKLDGCSGNTQSGVVMGTPSYMAPEQAQGATRLIGPATDVYGLGSILYEMLTGRPPFKAPTPVETVVQVLDEEPVPPSRLVPKVPRDLETICLKCLQKQPARRYPSAEELAEDLRAFLAGEPIQARPAGRWERALRWARRRPAVTVLLGAGGVALLGLLVGGWMYNAVAISGMAVLSLLAGAWWYNARLQAALCALAEQHAMAERHVEKLHFLLEMTHRLMGARDLDTLLMLISKTTIRMANAERATIYLLDRQRKEIWSKVAMGDGVGEIRVPLGVGIAGTVAATGETINISEAYGDPRFNPEIDKRTGYTTRNMLTFPMRSHDGKILGVFQILNKRGGGFQADDVETLAGLAASAAVAVENTRYRPADSVRAANA